MPEPKVFFWMAASVPDFPVVNPNGIKTLLDNDLSTFVIKGKPVFSNGNKSLSKGPLDYTILESWVFDKSILVDEPLGKALLYWFIKIYVENYFSH